jgi:NADPH:quinone reductase-like Zn-dependent oxidoreductase
VHDELRRLLESGEVDPMIHLQVPLEDAARALADLADRRTVGKVIVHVAA